MPPLPDVSHIHMDRTTDLRKRGEKSVLVKKPGVSIEEDVVKNYVKVEVMDPLIEEYRETYSQDLGTVY